MFGCLDTWLLWQLTGKKVFATDYSNASITMLFDPFQVIIELSHSVFHVDTKLYRVKKAKCIYKVATNLENLEYSGTSLNMKTSGNSRNSVQPQGKIVTNKLFLVCHSNICVKQLLTG